MSGQLQHRKRFGSCQEEFGWEPATSVGRAIQILASFRAPPLRLQWAPGGGRLLRPDVVAVFGQMFQESSWVLDETKRV